MAALSQVAGGDSLRQAPAGALWGRDSRWAAREEQETREEAPAGTHRGQGHSGGRGIIEKQTDSGSVPKVEPLRLAARFLWGETERG